HERIYLSNTYILESKYNWSGICIEANPVTFKKLKNNRHTINLNVCLDRSEGEVNFVLRDVFGGIVDQNVDNKTSDTRNNEVVTLKTTSLSRVCEDQHVPSFIDYLSIVARRTCPLRQILGVGIVDYSAIMMVLEQRDEETGPYSR